MIDKKMLEKQAENGEVEPKEIGEGVTVYKDITIKHPDPNVYESGAILLEEGAQIDAHTHIDDSETYVIIVGVVEINGATLESGQAIVCNQGESHYCKNLFEGYSIVGFAKKK